MSISLRRSLTTIARRGQWQRTTRCGVTSVCSPSTTATTTPISLFSSSTLSRQAQEEGVLYNTYEAIKVIADSEDDRVLHIVLNRPTKGNAMNNAMWTEIRDFFQRVSTDTHCRAIVLSGAGKHFCAGIDLAALPFKFPKELDVSRIATRLRPLIADFQESFTAIEKNPKPVIAAIHQACIGAGVDLVTACDIRLCSEDAYFAVKEVDVGLAADVGTLQRLPKVIGSDSLVRELCYTGRKLAAAEARECGLVSSLATDYFDVIEKASKMARTIAQKSPIAVEGTKMSLVYSRDHSVQDGLSHVGTHNTAMLQSADLRETMKAAMEKRAPSYGDL
eukprot:TRINITY_DN6013_c0_g1_i2.p1 TRINITY_DN6013_c0_g1~~TRINITY_DN6013_c0_g1_i2.p1  ORF type:complete len:367 (+),score=93.14 TRINITY_DN6013_c0_g1_i2:101-1102(+)